MRFNVPSKPTTYKSEIENFLGIDLQNAPAKCSLTRSPDCPNMIRDFKGINRKRYGYETIKTYDGKINGFHVLYGDTDKMLIHSGTKMYDGDTVLYSSMANALSSSFQMNGKLYIIDGTNYLVYDGSTIADVSSTAYVPTTLIAGSQSGGGTAYDPINLLTPKRIEQFITTGGSTYALSQTNIDSDAVTVDYYYQGSWRTYQENPLYFTVNRTTGVITFAFTIETSTVDNIRIHYSKTVSGYADRIKKCRFGILYGLNGLKNKLFLSGNPDYCNRDWYCETSDPTYFPDTYYGIVGQDSSSIVGYSIVNDYLVTHKDQAESNYNANLRQGTYTNNQIYFNSVGSFPAAGAVGIHTFANFDNEPVYATTDGNISAITATDVIGEKQSQERSYYISKALKSEDLANSYACRHQDFYCLACPSGTMYLLDNRQPVYEKNTPYSNRQYEAYKFTNINARCLFSYNNVLYFGTEDNKVKRFGTPDNEIWTDDGATTTETVYIDGNPVTTTVSYKCYWDTAEWYGSKTELKKTIRHLAVLLASHRKTGCRIWAKIDGIWEVIFDYNTDADYFDFNDIDFNRFTFRTDETPTLTGGKMKIKNILHTQFRFENSKPEPFGVYMAVIKYRIGNDYIK